MTYGAVADALADFDPPSAIALPDGSIDRQVAVCDAGGRVDRRERFGERVAAGEAAFRFRDRGARPGGMAVNMADQVARLGDDVTLFGHVEESVDLPFETVRLGDPARVTVAGFDDGDLLFAEPSEDIRTCDARRLRRAGAFDRDPELVCVGNWATVPGLGSVLRALAEAGDGHVVVDPGPVDGVGRDRVEAFAETLRAVGGARPVAVSANRSELRSLARGVGIDGDAEAALPDLRDSFGVDRVVLHETSQAAAATADGAVTVANLETTDAATNTGGGDRFSAGLGAALAAGWETEAALGLGNACASYHVQTGETGSPDDLRDFLL